MYAALAGGGTIDGVRLLSRETLARATEVQATSGGRLVVPFDMRWRLGYHGVVVFHPAASPVSTVSPSPLASMRRWQFWALVV